MHEGQFTEQIVNVILQELKKFPDKQPRTVHLKIGEVFHLIPDAVRMHFQVLTRGTLLEGVGLDFEEEKMEVRCDRCQKINPVEDHHLPACPLCYSTDVTTVSGNRITIESIELN